MNLKKISIYCLILAFGALFSQCTKEGPMGPAGADGIDANSTCIECHDASTDMEAKEVQWAASGHATGMTFERNTGDCAACHTAGGFEARLASGEMDNGTINNPSPHTCRSCHNIHDEYSLTSDYGLVNDGPATSLIDGTVTLDLGTGSLCAYCHQGRSPGDMSGAEFEVTSAYWGVHHGPQGDIFNGSGAYDFGTPYTSNNQHAGITNACVDCHMGEAYGSQAGGHTFSMTYEYHGSDAVWDASCVSCHNDDAHDKIDALTAEVQPKIDLCATLLFDAGLLAEDLAHAVAGTYSTDDAGALLNYLMIKEDRSIGVHNPNYVNDVLDATIAHLQAGL